MKSRTSAKLVLVTPAVALFGVFYTVPVLAGIVLSFFDWDGISPPRYVGFTNYELLLGDPLFLTNLRVTLIVVGASLVTVLPAALLLAVCLTGSSRLLAFFRWALFIPAIMPLAAVALLWSEMLSPADGAFVNALVGLFGIAPQAWLGDDALALWALIFVSTWSILGFHIVLQLSFLSAIPVDLLEAARLETTSRWKVYRHVVLPLLRDGLTVSATLTVTGSFVFFTGLAFIMTAGGPVHGTEVLGLRAYIEGFQELDFGTASAVTVLTMLLTIALVGTTLFVGSRRRVEY